MSQPEKVFQRLQADGWLVLSGPLPSLGGETPQFAERMLDRVDLSRMPLFLTLDETVDNSMRQFIDDLETLLDVPVKVIQVHRALKTELDEACMTANLIVLAGGRMSEWIKVFDPSTSDLKPQQMIGEGRLVLVTGSAASILGSWTFLDKEAQPIPGLGWLTGAVVLPEVSHPAESPAIKQFLAQQKFSYALGFPRGAILAMGPRGEIEVWGDTAPAVALGIGWGEV